MNSTVPLLASVAIICRHFPELSRDLRVVETIQAFVDSSVAFSLPQACENSPLGLVQRVLARTGWNIEKVVDGLCVAAKQGNLDILKWLSEVGNQISRTRVQNLVNYRNSGKTTALYEAAQFGHLEVVKWLIDNGARVATQNFDGQTAMLVAAANGHLLVVQWLVEKGSFVNEINRRGRNAVHLTAKNGHLKMAKWLVEHGAAVNLKDRIDRTPMHLAAENGHKLVVEYLVKHLVHSFDIDVKDYEQLTALHLAAGRGHLSVVQCLVSKGARINQRARHGQTALHFAAGGGHIEVAQWLADSGAAVRGDHFDFISSLPSSTTGNGSQTALCDAAMNGYLPVVEFFVERGLDPYMVNEIGHTPLYYATIGRRFHVVEFFLTKYSAVEKWQQSELWRVLFAAAKGDQDDILKLLYEQYWSVICLPNTQGRTPLHSAAASGELKAVQCLLGHEVNPHQVDTFGISPCIEACRHRHLDVLRCFLDAGVNMNASNLAGRTALHCAADAGFVDIVDELLVYGVDMNLQDRRGWTPLHCAAASGKLNVVAMLVGKGAAVNAETISGKTALVIAMEKGRSSVTDYLMKQAELAFASTLSKTSGTVALSNYSAYTLNSTDIHLESINGKHVGMWLDSPIEVKFKDENQSTNFFEELDRWSKLNHPHLVKLYGFCYNSDGHIPMFVYERATKGSLLEFLGDPMNPSARSKLWDKLYEASLGLQYLHDRNIVHGELSCDSIVISGSGSAKLRNLGKENTTAEYRLPWTAPEILAGFPATFESDVYAFGITIVEAVKRVAGYRSTPWSIICNGDSVFQNLTSHILSGGTPDKPVDITDAQWQLVKRMRSYNPRDRISASDVARELETFTTNFKVLHEITLGLSKLNAPPPTWANLGDFVVDETSLRTISNVLEDIEVLCGNSSPMDMMYRDVYSRLADVFHQLKTRQDEPTRDLVQHYADILCHFSKKLQNAHTIGSASAVRFAESRQGADNTFSIHGNLDLFIERANLSRLSQLHQWREIWDRQRKKQQHEMLEKLENLPGLMDEIKDEKQREIALAYLRFELSKHPTCYAASKTREFARAKSAITSIAPQKNTSWFIPAYEVEFDKFDEFSRGAFGKVYLGKWKRSRVVVKKLKLKNEEHEVAFLNEVEIWHLLYHPHIVQLFGACHIGQPFFVCEYAGGGQLDRYLKKHPNEAMEKLYEAALGLRYLHVKRVVHGDLKCNNILIGSDGRAKLADFGLSTLEPEMPSETTEPESEEQSKEKPKIGAIRWKAPEVLQGEKSSFASDIYSFGMCVLEAVSGAFPWGLLEDIAVKYYVLKEQRIPRCPGNCSEQVYDLVQQMCRFTPGERVDIHQVVKVLKTLIPRSRLERV